MSSIKTSKQKSYKQIDVVKNQIIDNSLSIGSILGVIAVVININNYIGYSNIYLALIDFFVVGSFCIITLIRKKLRIEVKALSLLIGILLLVFTDVFKLGVYSDAKVLIILIPLFALLGFSYRNTIFIYAFSILLFLFCGYLYYYGIIETKLDLILFL